MAWAQEALERSCARAATMSLKFHTSGLATHGWTTGEAMIPYAAGNDNTAPKSLTAMRE